jgi:hypothetical protein
MKEEGKGKKKTEREEKMVGVRVCCSLGYRTGRVSFG